MARSGNDRRGASSEANGEHGAVHETVDHFPTRDELLAMQVATRVPPSIDAHALQLALRNASQRLLEDHPGQVLDFSWLFSQPWFMQFVRAFSRPRINHLLMQPADRDRFNSAVQAAHADGSYQALSMIHAQDHMMHGYMPPYGQQRFLPWHRLYVWQFEELLRQKDPGLTVPYWDYSIDYARPDWVWQPPGVVRNAPGLGQSPGSLPNLGTVGFILAKSSYTDFTVALETFAHNDVHNWCNGTITTPSTAAQDPMFWLLHSNVDRIWDVWQSDPSHTGKPALFGPPALLDPWTPTSASDVDTVWSLGYSYV